MIGMLNNGSKVMIFFKVEDMRIKKRKKCGHISVKIKTAIVLWDKAVAW